MSQAEIKNILKEIQKDSIKEKVKNKKRQYKVEKYFLQKNKLIIHNKSKIAVKRTYQFYLKFKGDQKGLLSQKFSKIRKEKYFKLLKG